jgi:hypothetical protein
MCLVYSFFGSTRIERVSWRDLDEEQPTYVHTITGNLVLYTIINFFF